MMYSNGREKINRHERRIEKEKGRKGGRNRQGRMSEGEKAKERARRGKEKRGEMTEWCKTSK